MSEQKRQFTGVWIPKHIIEDEKLTWTDRGLYAEIASFNVCVKSNQSLADRMGLSVSGLRKCLKKLVDAEYVRVTAFNGRNREIIALSDRQHAPTVTGRVPVEGQAACPHSDTIDNILDNILDNKEKIYKKEKSSFREIEELNDEVLQEIADKYSLSLIDVRKKKESLHLWLEEQPGRYRLNGRRRNLKMTLMKWLRLDIDRGQLKRRISTTKKNYPVLSSDERSANLQRLEKLKNTLTGAMQ